MPVQSVYQYANLPPWLEAAQQDLAAKAKTFLGEKYKPYATPDGKAIRRLAKTNPDIENADTLIRNTGNIYEPYLREAHNLAAAGGQNEFTGEQRDRYMNPYIEGVIDKLSEKSGKAFREQYLPALQREFISNGAYGGTDYQGSVSRLLAEHQNNLDFAIKNALQEGYNTAGKQFESAQARKIEAAPHLRETGPLMQAGKFAEAEALKAIGQEKRAREQQGLDLAYQNWQKQEDFPYRQAQTVAGILSGMPQNNQEVYQAKEIPEKPQLNTVGQLGALAANIYGARMAGGYGRKRGGSIKKAHGLSSLSLMQGTMARKPKVGGSLGIKKLKNKDKMLFGKSNKGRSIS